MDCIKSMSVYICRDSAVSHVSILNQVIKQWIVSSCIISLYIGMCKRFIFEILDEGKRPIGLIFLVLIWQELKADRCITEFENYRYSHLSLSVDWKHVSKVLLRWWDQNWKIKHVGGSIFIRLLECLTHFKTNKINQKKGRVFYNNYWKSVFSLNVDANMQSLEFRLLNTDYS